MGWLVAGERHDHASMRGLLVLWLVGYSGGLQLVVELKITSSYLFSITQVQT